ncbi:cupin domain-containing protein [Acidobacteriota bacterium]
MPHIQAKQESTPPGYLTVRLSPVDPLPQNPFISNYGIDIIAPESATPQLSFNKDRWWIIIEGIVEVDEGEKVYQAGPGDMIYIPMLKTHSIKGITLTKIVWLEGPPLKAEE